MMLPDYISNDPYLKKIPTKEELIEKNNEEKITKEILYVIAYTIATCQEQGKNQAIIPVKHLEKLGYQAYKHENIVIEFFKSKGYIVIVDDDGFAFQLD